MSLPLICNICKKESEIHFNYEIEDLLKVNKDYSCNKCNGENFRHLISKYNITSRNLFTKKEFKNSIWDEPIIVIVLSITVIFIVIAFIIAAVKNWNNIGYAGLILGFFIYFLPFGVLAFLILESFYKKILKTINLDNEYEKYCLEKKESNESFLEYKLLIEIRKSFAEKNLDINKIKSAIKFLKWQNESDDYFIISGMILQIEEKFEEAINILKKVNSKSNRNDAIRLIADSYFSLKEYQSALSYYNKYSTFDLRDKSIVDSMMSSCHTLIKSQKFDSKK